MSHRCKTIVFWLLLLALPTQGLATATMLFCDVAPHRDKAGGDAMMSGHPHHAAGIDLVKIPNPCHGSEHDAKCAGCMAYCAGALMMPSPPLMPALATRDLQPAPPASVSPPGPGIDGLYRPPRPVLA